MRSILPKIQIVSLLLTATMACSLFAQSGLDNDGFDKGIRPQDDLFQAVNGMWLKNTPIPSDKSNYGSFSILDDMSQERIRAIIEDAAQGTKPKGSDAQKVGDFYKSFMDKEKAESLGASPVKSRLAEIEKIGSVSDLVKYYGAAKYVGIGSPIGLFVGQDAKDSSRYIANVAQSGTSLPDRDYYLEDEERFLKAREALKSYITKLFLLAELPTDGVAEQILDLETKLAEIQWSRVEMRDAEARYNLHTVEEAAASMTNMDPREFFAAAGVGQITEVNVMTPSFFEGLDRLISEIPLDVWKKHAMFRELDSAAPILSDDFVQAHFEFRSKELAGVPELKPRWKRGVEMVAGGGAGDFGALGEVVGRLYVEQHFKPEAKARMEELVGNLVKAYEKSINDLTWMTDETKAKAQEKLSKFTTKIGYTNKWRDYSALKVEPNDLIGNVLRSNKVDYDRMINKLGQPIDREEWGMTPQTVNAYYNPGKNEIVFPAAILQPPFFDPTADDAVNYGGIGAVIGHEISHGFDDQGSKYDGDGNLKNWWSDKDRYEFKQLTQRLVDQYSEYSPLEGKNVNGELTLGENIADLSGLSIAYKAYKLSLNGETPAVIDDWTGDQRFFLGWSQVWRRKYRDAEMIRRLKTDSHSPSWYRANGPVVNIDVLHEAFGVKEGDALYKAPEKRIRIW